MRYTRRQVSQALMGFGASQQQAEAFTGVPRVQRRRTGPGPEQAIVQAILAYLKLRGIFAFRVNTQGVPLHDGSGGFRPAPTTGISDILCVLRGGRFGAIEVKSATGRVSAAQQAFHDRVRAAGGWCLVARSVDDVIAGLEGT